MIDVSKSTWYFESNRSHTVASHLVLCGSLWFFGIWVWSYRANRDPPCQATRRWSVPKERQTKPEDFQPMVKWFGFFGAFTKENSRNKPQTTGPQTIGCDFLIQKKWYTGTKQFRLRLFDFCLAVVICVCLALWCPKRSFEFKQNFNWITWRKCHMLST